MGEGGVSVTEYVRWLVAGSAIKASAKRWPIFDGRPCRVSGV